RYDRDAHDIFAVQDELAHAVAATVGGRVDAAGRERSQRLSSTSLRAYDLVLRARALWLRFSRADNAEARLLAEKAVELDSTSARAHAQLATCLFEEYTAHWTAHRESSLRQAYESAQRAVHLDESDSFGWEILGFVQLMRRKFD